jgi:hypothetical protein
MLSDRVCSLRPNQIQAVLILPDPLTTEVIRFTILTRTKAPVHHRSRTFSAR